MKLKDILNEQKRSIKIDDETTFDVYSDGASVDVRAMIGGKQIGYAYFERDGSSLTPVDTAIDKDFQRRGIGKKIYDRVKSLGFKIVRSDDQTTAGKAFWDKHQGTSSRVWEMLKSLENESRVINEASLVIDVPNDDWLKSKVNYAIQRGRDRWGVPYMGSTTGYIRGTIRVPVDVLKDLSGMRNEQQNVRKDDLAAIKKIMKGTGKLPTDDDGDEYAPFVMVAHNGEAWVNEGNHRIMAAVQLGWKDLPVEIRYFDGGERVKTGPLYPPKIGLG
jgi:hypothetical protein